MCCRSLAALTAACCMIVLVVGSAAAAGTVRSGPQVGVKVPGPFLPLNINGPEAGKKACLYCRNGSHPVAMVFAREVTPTLVDLIKRIDGATGAHGEEDMGSFVVFCSDDQALPGQLARLAKEENLKHIILATFPAAGPPRYQIAPDADTTVVLYRHFTVKANQAFKKGECTARDVDKIMADLPLILAEE
jgi:hypothetical protein